MISRLPLVRLRQSAFRVGLSFALLSALFLPAAAAAEIITVGSPMEGIFAPSRITVAGTYLNLAVADPEALLTSPVDGAVVGFRVASGEGGPYVVRVLRPDGANTFTAIASGTPVYFGVAGLPSCRRWKTARLSGSRNCTAGSNWALTPAAPPADCRIGPTQLLGFGDPHVGVHPRHGLHQRLRGSLRQPGGFQDDG